MTFDPPSRPLEFPPDRDAAMAAVRRVRRSFQARNAILLGNISFILTIAGLVAFAEDGARLGPAHFVALGAIAIGWLALVTYAIATRPRPMAAPYAPLAAMSFRRRLLFFVVVYTVLALSYVLTDLWLRYARTNGLEVAIAGGLGLVWFYVLRFVAFRLWEDLLFGCGVVGAWALYISKAHDMAWLAVLPAAAVLIAGLCLFARCRHSPLSGDAAADDGGH